MFDHLLGKTIYVNDKPFYIVSIGSVRELPNLCKVGISKAPEGWSIEGYVDLPRLWLADPTKKLLKPDGTSFSINGLTTS